MGTPSSQGEAKAVNPMFERGREGGLWRPTGARGPTLRWPPGPVWSRVMAASVSPCELPSAPGPEG
jgi:hypothetical protein